MNTIDLRSIIDSRNPGFLERFPQVLSGFLVKSLESILHLKEVNRFLSLHSDKQGYEFIDEIFEYLDFDFFLSSKDRLKIPAEGRLICVANHPLGALDGIAAIKALGEVRRDVKVIANDVLMTIENMQQFFLPYNIFSRKTQKNHLHAIKEALMNDEAVLFFPAAEVSRFGLRGVRDGEWQKGPLYFAAKYQVPILPMYIKASNSALFYILSSINKASSMFLLSHELLNKRSKTITFKIGDPIPGSVFARNLLSKKIQTKLLKKHVYQIGQKKNGLFKTIKTVIHPVDRKLIKLELAHAHLLNEMSDGKKLYMVEYEKCPNILKEISRLREITFRQVGEGTGDKKDFDSYDKYFKHIILWSEEELEIIGAYRLGIGKEIISLYGTTGFYNSSLFSFKPEFEPYLQSSIELGRSFIQQAYWRSNALDCLWQGIGTYLHRHHEIKYLFGAVSISNNYSAVARNLIVSFYRKWYGSEDNLAEAKNRFVISKHDEGEAADILTGTDYSQDYLNLKITLKNLGYSIPVLLRQYTELCERDGVKFLDFCVDEDFSNTVDGLILLDLARLKSKKKRRYYPSQAA
ncbi:lysophospholipid acyltransferase family protein [candidate division KSB1 bacterium]|nr:lysophospholipid acyltransferase family protein [candidate division KSB1 bacterium]